RPERAQPHHPAMQRPAHRRRRFAQLIRPPAGGAAVPLQPAGVAPPRARLGERARRWRRLPELVVAPAGDGAVGLDPAGVAPPPPHLRPLPPARRPSPAPPAERPRSRRRPPQTVVSPPRRGAVGLQPTGRRAPRAPCPD